MKMKRKLLPILLLLPMLFLMACTSGPEKTVDNFFSEYKSLNIEKAADYTSSSLEEEYKDNLEDQGEGFGIDDFDTFEGNEELKDSFKKLTKVLDHKVVDVVTEGDTATVNLELTYADASEPIIDSISEMFGQLIGAAFTGVEMAEEQSTEIIIDTITKNLEEYEVIEANSAGVMTLEKIDGDWLITDFDDEVSNALVFGLANGLEDWNPFGDFELDEDVEFDGDVEFNEDIDVNVNEGF